MPFSTASLSLNPFASFTLALYAANLVIIGFVLYLIWHYATTEYRLIDNRTPLTIIRYGKIQCLVASAGDCIAFVFAIVSPAIALAMFVIIPLLYIIPWVSPLLDAGV